MEKLTSHIEKSEKKHCELEQKFQALTRLFDQQRYSFKQPIFNMGMMRCGAFLLCALASDGERFTCNCLPLLVRLFICAILRLRNCSYLDDVFFMHVTSLLIM
jgi:hypothetical protein